MDTKKPAKPVPATTAGKAAAVPATTPRPSLPSLSQPTDAKPDTAGAQSVLPAATTAAPVEAAKPACAPAEPTVAPTPASKPTETLGPKLRGKSEIIAALHAGAHVLHTEAGLYRIVEGNGTVHPASKRRILALIQQGVLKASGEGKGRIYLLDAEADKKASEKTPAAKPEAPA